MQSPYEIIPAIMPAGLDDLTVKIDQIVGLVPVVQLDIMDGIFVPEKTWPYRTDSEYADSAGDQAYWEAIQGGNAGLPMMDSVEYELDLMVDKPDQNLGEWLALQPSRIVFHVESIHDIEQLLTDLAPVRDIIQIGISFDDDYSIEHLMHHYVEHFDFVQVMGIDHIGKQGEPFEERVIHNILALQSVFPDKIVSVDGAVGRETITRLRDVGATRFVAGSAIYGEGDIAENIEYLKNLLD
ncbi:MAG: ribulose-phosphate 3-epimerase [Planctomycetota bacterium]|jgi:ribulose-phosphate 3-epimerase